VRADCVPVAKIPGLTNLYRDFLGQFPKVQQFYAVPPGSTEWRRHGASRSDYPAERRSAVADLLERQNRHWDASPAALANIDRLRAGASAVVTGQQITLFGGAMLSLLKAITAIKLAREATAAGQEHVPIFWMASEDHDLAEISQVSVPSGFGSLAAWRMQTHVAADTPVGKVEIGSQTGAKVEEVLKQAADLLGDTEILEILRESYLQGSTLADAYARLFARLFSQHGLIVMDAADPEFHAIGRPVFLAALRQHQELAAAISQRDKDLVSSGYHAQVAEVENGTLLFFIDQGKRAALRTHKDGFRAGARQFTLAELESELQAKPEQFSPNVLVRPVFQDYLLPTSAYIGGPAETAYFAQAEVVYRQILGYTTPVLPRLSATMVEQRIQHWLERYGLPVAEVFLEEGELERRLGAQAMPIELKHKLSALGQSLHRELDQFEQVAEQLDPTLAQASATAGSKMRYQMNRLRRLAANAELRKNADLKRHANAISMALYPNGHLQEREIGGVYFLGRYGTQLIQQLLDVSKTECTDHQVYYL